MRSAPAIGFEYRPSRLLAGTAAMLIVLAPFAIALGGMAVWVKAALAALTLIYGAFSLRRFLRPRVRTVQWRADGSVSIGLSSHGGVQVEAQAELHDARVLGPLIALHLRWPRGRGSLWLLPDNLDADTRRRLRMRLALDGVHASANPDSV